MAIKVGGIEVVDNNRQLKNINSVDSGSVNVLNSALNTDPTRGTLTKTFANGETASITLNQNVSTAPVVSVTKEVAQTGQSSKGAWDVNATASNYDLHNTAYATTLTPSAFDISSTPTELNATKKEYSLNTSQAGNSYDLFFKPDGTKMFIANGGNAGTANLVAYTLSTAWDITTASYANETYDTSAYESWPEGLWFKPDGTYVYLTSQSNTGVISFELTTAWDVSTANSVYIQNLSITDPKGVTFKPDGTIMYVGDPNNKSVKEFSLTTAWDITTASLTTTKNTQVQGRIDSKPTSISFNSDGTIMFINDIYAMYVQKFTLSTAWDISSATFDSELAYATISNGNAYGHFMDASGTRLYFTSYTADKVVQVTLPSTLSLGTGSFASTDVGKRIQGNGGDVILTSTSGAYDTTGGSDFTDSSTIASGSWTMHGLKSAGADDGLTLAGLTNVYSAGGSYTSSSFNMTTTLTDPRDMYISPDGQYMYSQNVSSNEVLQWTLGTAYDISTASYNRAYYYGTQVTAAQAMTFTPDGTKMFVFGYNADAVYGYNLSTAWDISTASHYNSDNFNIYGGLTFGIAASANGDLYVGRSTGDIIKRPYGASFNLSNPGTDQTFNFSGETGAGNNRVEGIAIADGKYLALTIQDTATAHIYHMSTANDLTTRTYKGSVDLSSETSYPTGISWSDGGTKFVVSSRLDSSSNAHGFALEYSAGSNSLPTSQYHLAVTNSGGQIDSSFWTDINSMTADQSLGDGEAYYAVSTDDRTTWSVAKGSDGVRPIVRDNSGTWQYNSDAGSVTGAFDISTAVFNQSKDVSADTPDAYSVIFKPDGTKMFILDDGFAAADDILEYNLSTAWDVSTATYSQAYRLLSSESAVQGMDFKSDGTQVYIIGSQTDAVYAYDLSTAWDISTASYNSVSFSTTSETTTPFAVKFKSDGTKMYTIGLTEDTIYEYNLSTAWDISTASYSGSSYYFNAEVASANNLTLNSTGTKLYLLGGSVIYEYTLSTAWDLSSISYNNVSFSVSSQESNAYGITFKPDGTKLYICGSGNDVVAEYDIGTISYSTSTTWTNATTNDEFYALQQALGYNAFNRMNKTQLDAVADGSHFTLGNTLDLMIALKQDTASASLPTSDGVTINYDAEALNQGAVLGTDYDFDFPASNQVRITSNAAQNLKIRVV